MFTIYLPSPDHGACPGSHNRAQDGQPDCSWHPSPKPHTTSSVAKRKTRATHCPGECCRQMSWRKWGEWSFFVAISPSPHVPIVPSQIAGTSSPFHMTLHNRDTDPRAPSLDHLKRNVETLCRWGPSRCTLSGLPLGPPLHWPLKHQAIGQGCIHLPGKVWGVKCWNPGLSSSLCPGLVYPWASVSLAVKWRPPTLGSEGLRLGEGRPVAC